MLNCKSALNHFQWAMINNHSDQPASLVHSDLWRAGDGGASLILSFGKQLLALAGLHEIKTQNWELPKESTYLYPFFLLCPVPHPVCVHMLYVCSRACVLADTHVHVCEGQRQSVSSREDFSLKLELTDPWGQQAAELWALVSVTPLTWLPMCIWDPNLCLNSTHTALLASLHSLGTILSILLSLLNSE